MADEEELSEKALDCVRYRDSEYTDPIPRSAGVAVRDRRDLLREVDCLRAQLAEVRVAAYARGVEVGQGMASKALADAREGFEKMRLLCRRDLHPNPADVELLVDNLARKMLGPFGHTEQVCQRAPHYGSCKALPALAAGGEKPGGKP